MKLVQSVLKIKVTIPTAVAAIQDTNSMTRLLRQRIIIVEVKQHPLYSKQIRVLTIFIKKLNVQLVRPETQQPVCANVLSIVEVWQRVLKMRLTNHTAVPAIRDIIRIQRLLHLLITIAKVKFMMHHDGTPHHACLKLLKIYLWTLLRYTKIKVINFFVSIIAFDSTSNHVL